MKIPSRSLRKETVSVFNFVLTAHAEEMDWNRDMGMCETIRINVESQTLLSMM
jgi:hypothetical protein